MKSREAAALRISDADEAILEALTALSDACQRRGVSVVAAVVGVATKDGMGCRIALNPAQMGEHRPDSGDFQDEVNEAMRKFVSRIPGVTVADLRDDGAKC